MQTQPPQPSANPPGRNSLRVLLLVIVLLVAVGSLVWLALGFGRTAAPQGTPVVAVSPTELAQATTGSSRGQGVGGPQPLTATPTAAPSSIQEPAEQAATATTPTPS